MKRTGHRRSESGYTLIELIIAITLLAAVTGAMVAAFITTNNANANTSERIHESNDAQLTAGFWAADAQAAGGTDPSLGTTDTTLGVSKSDAAGCGTGTPVVSFKWREWTDRDTALVDTFVTRVANYFYDGSTHELRRQACANGVSSSVVTLATRVESSPVVTCDGSLTCPSLPGRVQIIVTETNAPVNTRPGPYSFTLSATVRSVGQSAPTLTTATSSPLLVTGGSCTTGAGVTADNGNVTVRINGHAMINATNGSGCTACTFNGASHTWESDGTSIAFGGSCGGNHTPSPAWTNAAGVGDPFASLTPPSTSACGSGTNPAPGSDGYPPGVYPPGVYPQVLTLSGSQSLASVTAAKPAYVLCNGIAGTTTTRSNGVFLYVVNGGVSGNLSLSAPTSGTYQSLALWIRTTTTWDIGDVNIEGAVYGPKTDITMAGGASLTVSVLVVHSIDMRGNPDVAITGTGTPRSPILTAVTGTTLRTVNLSWIPQQFPGITITGYQLSADRGSGFGPWTTLAGGAATTSTPDVCGAADNVVTTCKYQVRALSAAGPGSPSNIATGTSWADTTPPVVTVTAPAAGATVGATTTFTGTATNAATDGTVITVQVYAGNGCVAGTEAGAPVQTTSTGTSWSVASPVMTGGARSVCAFQSDNAGNTGKSAARNFTVDTVGPTVTSVTLSNANGLLAAGDTVTVVFSKAMNTTTMCSAWAATGNQSINGNNQVTVTVADGGAGPDLLTVGSTTCTVGGFNFGSLNLGSAAWVPAAGGATFGGGGGSKSQITYTATTRTLVITLGAKTGSANTVAVTPAPTVLYTPSTAMKDSLGNAMAGAFSFVSQRF
jgi:Tfp pilus assembly protein PilW